MTDKPLEETYEGQIVAREATHLLHYAVTSLLTVGISADRIRGAVEHSLALQLHSPAAPDAVLRAMLDGWHAHKLERERERLEAPPLETTPPPPDPGTLARRARARRGRV